MDGRGEADVWEERWLGFVLAFLATKESKERQKSSVINEEIIQRNKETQDKRRDGGRGRAQRLSKATSWKYKLSLQRISSK